ncbi:MAG: sulfatase-like hydrolase/transferase [Pseudomonadota bacterium]
MKTRSASIRVIFRAWFALLVTMCAASSFAQSPANILLIYADDLGFGDLGHYGHPVIQTPNLDKLARQGMTFTAHYANSGLCSPSRAALLTGRYPYRSGIKSWIPAGSGIFLRDEELTLAEVLKEAGYSTALIGKWHLNADLGNPDEPQPNDQGFDYFYGHNAYQIPTNKNPTNIFRNRSALPQQKGFTAQLYADEAVNWLDARDETKPFFLMLSMAEPHTTIENPAEFNGMYARFTRGETIPIPSGLRDPPKAKLIPRGPGEYYANITYMDAQIGRVLTWLDNQGLSKNTVIVFTSDNGPVTSDWMNWWEVNAYGSTGGYRGRKHMLYEGGIRVPAIVKIPGVVEAGSVSNDVVLSSDFFSTLVRMGGGELPTDRPIDSVDLTDVLRGGVLMPQDRFWALDAVTELEYVVRRENWKLFIDRRGVPQELYDLVSDPLELFNLVEEQADKVAELVGVFEKTLSSIKSDPLNDLKGVKNE